MTSSATLKPSHHPWANLLAQHVFNSMRTYELQVVPSELPLWPKLCQAERLYVRLHSSTYTQTNMCTHTPVSIATQIMCPIHWLCTLRYTSTCHMYAHTLICTHARTYNCCLPHSLALSEPVLNNNHWTTMQTLMIQLPDSSLPLVEI